LVENHSKLETDQRFHVAGFVAIFIEASYLIGDWSNGKKMPIAITFFLLLAGFTSAVNSQSLSKPVDHWYCVELYQWAQTQERARRDANETSRLEIYRKRHEGFALILSGGSPLKADTLAAAGRFAEALSGATVGRMNVGNFYVPQSSRCLDLDIEQAPAINTLARTIIHTLPVGRVDGKQIEEREAFLRALPSATVREEPQIVVYTFIHTETGVEVRSDYIFTRTSHDAHPSVFSLSKRSSVDGPVSVSCNGSFAGPTGAAQLWIEWLKVSTRCNARS
jgi:hypothetical protein